MRKYIKNAVASLLLVVFLISFYLPAFAAGQPSSYSDSYNSGQRGVVCTTLSGTGAAAYYTGNYTYDKLDDLSSSQLLSALRTLTTSRHSYTSTYNDCKNKAEQTDCQNEDGKVLLLYTSVSTTASCNSGWNREHVWPKSLGGYETSGPGADLHHIRPTDDKVNSDRGNLKYGNLNGGTASYGNQAASGVLGGYKGSYFEPLDNAKGDVARICLYMYVRYGGSSSYTCNSITNVFQSIDVLLEWCALDPVDTWEMGRNEVVEDIQGNRNVFIDYPELAWLLFGKSVPTNMTTPSGGKDTTGSGNTGSGNTDSGNTGGSTGGNTGGNTDSGNTGGNTGGSTGGSTGGNTDSGNTGGSTGGNIGGSTGGNTGSGGNSGGNTGVDSIVAIVENDADKLLILLALGACDAALLEGITD